ncbi:hypothetical protein ALP75_205445 [Pseudomonas syringae pv. actinidiae]|nr:hypothetical protein ALP75_205445 [Pseudomonas syringae pv. actinidiae]
MIGETPQRRVQRDNLLGRRTFLRAEGMRSAVRPAQRIIDVGSNLDAHVGQAWIETAQVDAGQIRKRQAAGRQRLVVDIEKACAQCHEHTAAAVIGCAATDCQNDAPGSGVQRRKNQLPGACGAGDTGIALFKGQ